MAPAPHPKLTGITDLLLSGWWQLHAQMMLPPFLPFHYWMYKHGAHFTSRRWFPVQYVMAPLKACNGEPIPDAADMDIDALLDYIIQKHSLNYDAMYQHIYEGYGKSHDRLCNWSPKDFEAMTVENKDVVSLRTGLQLEEPAAKVRGADTLCLQNYGRPYNESGKPSGTYYKYAKTECVPSYGEWIPAGTHPVGL